MIPNIPYNPKIDQHVINITDTLEGHQVPWGKSVTEATDGEGHWVTIDGHPIFIGGNNQVTKDFVKSLPKPVQNNGVFTRTPTVEVPTDARPFVDAVVEFTGENYGVISDRSYDINTKGLKVVGTTSYASDAQLINNAVREAEPQEVDVFRGVGSRHLHPTLINAKVGDEMTIGGVKSFSYDKKIAADYSNAVGGGYHSYLLEIKGSAKGVNASAISSWPEEQEFITQGRFKVTGIGQIATPDGVPVKTITLQQTGVF